MIQFIVTYMPWLLSVNSIYITIIAGNKDKRTWIIGLGNQVLWLTWIICSESWGLVPMNLFMWVIYTRNHFKWNQKA